MSEQEKKKDVGYMWRIGCQTAEGITIDITGNFGLNADDNEINAQLDRFHNIFSRQRAKTVLAEEKRLLVDQKNTHAQLVEQLRVASEKQSTRTADKQQLESLKQNVERMTMQIAAREKGIESLEKLTV